MSFKTLHQVPTPTEIKQLLPLPAHLAQIKAERDRVIMDIFTGKDSRFVLIVGPCSAHDPDAVLAYAEKLAWLQEKVAEKIMLIPRVYTNKPRTTGEGYKGMMHQPNPNEIPNITEGIKAIRTMQIRVIEQTHLSSADEMLYPDNMGYMDDLLSYHAVGARSVENQKHRLIASGIDVPVGMKNPTSGDIGVMLNSIKAAQLSHVCMHEGKEVQTSGNPVAHAILRGAVNQYGRNIPNYHYEDLRFVAKKYAERELANPAVIVDCNHANSIKQFKEQPRIALDVLRSMRYSDAIRGLIKGLMIESYLVEGSQPVGGCTFGQSITDACLGWEDTETLILEIADAL
jgi:3-deoxy-7-phosphoheptulonate synthase